MLLTISVANTRVRTNEPPECERWRYRIATFYGCTELTLVDLAQGALTCREQLKIVVTENATFREFYIEIIRAYCRCTTEDL